MSALDFEASNTTRYFGIAAGPVLPNADWSIGGWFRPSRAISAVASESVISIGTFGGANAVTLSIRPDDINFAGSDSGGADLGTLDPFIGTFGTTGLDWFFLYQRRSSVMQAYVSVEGSSPGSPNQTIATGQTAAVNSAAWSIGRRQDGDADRYWKNPLGEIFVLVNDSLAVADVQTLVAGAGITAVRPSPRLYLKFRENNATETDQSGNGFDATRNGSGYSLVTEFFPEPAVAVPVAWLRG